VYLHPRAVFGRETRPYWLACGPQDDRPARRLPVHGGLLNQLSIALYFPCMLSPIPGTQQDQLIPRTPHLNVYLRATILEHGAYKPTVDAGVLNPLPPANHVVGQYLFDP